MPPNQNPDPNAVKAAHTTLQRLLLDLLADQQGLSLPIGFDGLLRVMFDRFASLRGAEGLLGPNNVEMALHELSNLVNPVHPGSVRFDRGGLVFVEEAVLRDFRQRLMGQAAPPEAAAEKKGRKLSTGGLGVDDGDEAEMLQELLGKKSIKQQEKQEQTDELLALISKPTAKQSNEAAKFRTAGGSKLKEFCRNGTKEQCAQKTGFGPRCAKIHFRRILKPHTDPSLGDCSYLDTCRHMATCKFIHYEVDAEDANRMREGQGPLDPFSRQAANRPDSNIFTRHYESQFVNCDIRNFPMEVLGKYPVIMADPPWDIHMQLPYGTMADEEMRRMNVQCLQDDGVIFLWVTGRAMELGRECLHMWGYEFVQELLWVKTNQLQRIIRTGRTGHWINHSKEHCLIGIKGKPQINNNIDCDVVCAEVRETSRKPDEMYDLLERLAPGTRKLELFGRPHNVHKGWTTLGNQLGKSQISEPWLRERLLDEGIFEEDDLAPMPPPPEDPFVPPWGGHKPPPRLNLAPAAPMSTD